MPSVEYGRCPECGETQRSHTLSCRLGAYGNLPNSPVGPMEQAGIEFFAVYEANIDAGFTPPQSLYLLAVQMTGNPGIAPGLDLPDPPSQD